MEIKKFRELEDTLTKKLFSLSLSLSLSLALSRSLSLPLQEFFFTLFLLLSLSLTLSVSLSYFSLPEPAAPYIAALPWNDRNIIEEKKPERRHKKEKIVDPREFQESKASPFMGSYFCL